MMEDATARARWTLFGAVIGSVMLLGVVVVLGQRSTPVAPAAARPEPWEPPTPAASPILATTTFSPSPVTISPSTTRPPTRTRPPATTRPPTTRPPAATRPPATTPPPAGPNLSLRGDGGADGSTKATGRSFKDVRDGDLGTFWSPIGVTGEISVKWPVPVTVSTINIREAAGGGKVGAWQVRNHDNDRILATGSGAGVITFPPVALRKVTFVILSANGTPRIAEYETFTD